jgi:hypothetical protein
MNLHGSPVMEAHNNKKKTSMYLELLGDESMEEIF